MKSQEKPDSTTPGTPFKNNSDSDRLSFDSFTLDKKKSQPQLHDSEFDFDFSVRVLVPTKSTLHDPLNIVYEKTRDLIYQEETNHSFKPKSKKNFLHDLKFLFLRDNYLTFSKFQINRLGKN